MSKLALPYKINIVLIITFIAGYAYIVITGLNKDLFILINSHKGNLWSFVWANLSFLGDTMVAIAILILFIRSREDLVLAGIMAAFTGTLIVNFFKIYYNMPRPPAVIDKDLINIIGPAIISHSFPSGHSVTVFSTVAILLFVFKSHYIRIGLILLALLVGISRIAVGVHWPSDVLAGAAIGCICGIAGIFVVAKTGLNKLNQLQIPLASILLLLNFYILFFYDYKYEQAKYLHHILFTVIIIAGTRETYLLIKSR